MFIKLYWQNTFVYRVTFVMWRFRQFLSSIMALTVWSVIFSNQDMAFGYQQDQIIAYVFLVSVLYNIISTTSLNDLTGEIYSGKLSVKLVKPINIILSFGFRDLADKLMNIGFVIIESMILFLIFKPSFVFPDLFLGLVFIVWVILAALIAFLINLLFGSIGFWSRDSWGPRFLYYMILDFTAGKLYPLDILPVVVQKAIYFTPFPYMSYVQIQLFLGRLEMDQILPISLAMITWVIGLTFIFRKIWHKGLRNYTSMGQ